MEEKIYLKKFEVLGLGKEPLIITIPTKCEKGITNLYKINFPEKYYFVYPDFLMSLRKFLITGETCNFCNLYLYNDVLELQITFGKEGSKKISVYSIILEKTKDSYLNIISECLSVEGKIEIFRDQWEGIVCKDEVLEENLIQDLKVSKDNCLRKSIIISNFMSALEYPEVDYIIKKISILDLNYYVGEISKKPQYETLGWINLHFSKKVQSKTIELLCGCFSDIDEITEDFKIKEKGIELNIEDQGSGFITCLVLFLHLFKVIVHGERGTILLMYPLGSLHFILKKAVLEYFDKALKEVGGQLLLFTEE